MCPGAESSLAWANADLLLTHWPLGDRDAILKLPIFNLVLLIGIFTSSKDNALRLMQWDLTDDKSTLVQVMAWCRQAPSHYLSQCWPSSMSPYGVTRPQWVNQTFWKNFSEIWIKIQKLYFKKIHLICHLQNVTHFLNVIIHSTRVTWYLYIIQSFIKGNNNMTDHALKI